MVWLEVSNLIVLVLVTAVLVFLSGRLFLQRRTPLSNLGGLLLLGMAEWTLTNALELGSVGFEAKLFWYKLQYLGMALMPLLWLLYVLQYSGRGHWIRPPLLIALSIVPLIILVLAYTNQWHGLMWTDMRLASSSPFSSLQRTREIGFWLHVGYIYLVVSVAFWFLLQMLVRSHTLYRWQMVALLGAALLPASIGLLDIVGIFPPNAIDPVALTFGLPGLLIAWGIFRLRLGDIVPVAREVVIESMRDGVLVLDGAGHVLDLNPVARQLVGKTSKEVIGHSLSEVWPELAGHISRLEREPKKVFQEHDRSVFDVYLSPILDWRSHQVGQTLVLHDVTEYKRIEEALRRAEREKALVLDSISELVTYLDQDMRVIWTNRTAAGYVGERPEDLVGRFCYQIWFKRDTPCDDCPAARALLTGQSQGGQMVNSDQRVLDVRGYPVRNQEGHVVGAVEVALDVTEHESLERQFLRAQKMEAVGRLAGGVAHDFNNLLTAISGYTSLLLDDPEVTESQRSDLGEIAIASNRAAILTRQLLAFARKQMLRPQVLDLNVLIGDLVKMIERLIGEDIELTTELDPALGAVRADPGQIEQIVMNLVVNARDAMPEGGQLILTTANVDLDWDAVHQQVDMQPGSYVVLSLRDTGAGMPPEVMAHLFEPFFTTKEVGQGSGLGLSTVYGIVRQHDGHIMAQSEPEQGTTFQIYLPRIDHATMLPVSNSTVEESLKGSETILLVEDENAVRVLTRTILTQLGYRVLEASSGAEALVLSKAHPRSIDLLLTDVIMPGMNGRRLAQELLQSRPNTRVLYISGYTDGWIGCQSMVDADQPLLQKPFTPGILARKVREVLEAPPLTGE